MNKVKSTLAKIYVIGLAKKSLNPDSNTKEFLIYKKSKDYDNGVDTKWNLKRNMNCVYLYKNNSSDLQEEFCVSTYTSNFPKCVSYKNGEYTYDLDSIRIIFAYYFKENIIQFENAINRSK